uniref:Putative membrane protein n=3 Tax=Rhizobium rhizogenes TaxID=359 RepID=A0A7S5DS78_RHIRH|nr:putative membrane protein [Rhizobium rhizogenes]QCL10500.1 putative membrane protein [Rhizobium rhizogenes]
MRNGTAGRSLNRQKPALADRLSRQVVVFLHWHINCVSRGRPSEETVFMLQIFPPLLLSIALGLSWNRFLLTFASGGDSLQNQMPVTMVAAAVSLSALALSVADKGLFLGGAMVVLGLALAVISKNFSYPVAIVGLSVVSLAAYLQLTIHAP